jgi:DNA-binding NarL/FixJ family response regulator
MEVGRDRTSDTKFTPDLAPRRTTPAVIAKPRTFIVSDVRLYRDGLTIALSSRKDLLVGGTAGTLESLLPLIDGGSDNVVLLDTGMPQALEIARGIIEAAPRTKIIAIAVAEDAADVIACAEAGMGGYVSREGSVDDVASAIHNVVRGEFTCSPRMISTIFEQLARLAPHRVESGTSDTVLTRRESEIVSLIDEGLSNKEIGRTLRIGTTTVKNHVHHILEKLHVTRRAQAAAALRATKSVPAESTKHRRAAMTRMDRAD